MKIVIDISEDSYKATCNGCMLPPDVENVFRGIKNGVPLPDGAEILTKEAYSDLCTRAADVPDTNVGDLISRQAAINALWKALYEYEDKTEKQFIELDELNVADWIEHRIFVQNMSDIDRQTILALPSAWPEKRTEERTKTHACDCISRQAAKLKVARVTWADGDSHYDFHDKCVDCLDDLPPVTPQPKIGRWIYDGDCIICNKCLKAFGWISMNMASKYCPNCGAKMEVN